jgi:hypothetical protein
MRTEDVRQYLDRRPFQHIRLHLSSGAFFDIRQPRMAEVSRSTLTVGLELEGDKQRFVVISLMHIFWLEVLVPAT